MSAATDDARPTPRLRKMEFPFDGGDIPPHWAADNPFLTHLVNGLNLLFPKGERFFIRSVREFADRVGDAGLRERVRGFMGQEVRHGMEHEAFFDALEAQGYDVRRFLERYERIAYDVIEPRVGPELRLATTVALEHYTATLAEFALTDGLQDMHPLPRALLLWHAAEEIEHKSVAFDVLQEVDPSYRTRIGGLVVATGVLVMFWTMATADLLRQDRTLGRRRRSPGRHGLRMIGRILRKGPGRRVARGIAEYLRPGFHPDQRDNYHLAESYLEGIGRLAG